MSEGEVLVSGGEASESGEEIFESLPPWMPRHESSGNFKLLDVVGRGFDRIEDDINDAQDASNVQTAQSIDQLKEIAKLVDVSPTSESDLSTYRSRVISGFQSATNEGDLPGIFENVSTLLDIDEERINFLQGGEQGAFILSVPGSSFGSDSITQEEFAEIISDQVAAGYRADIQRRGTFTYLNTNQYSNDDHNSDNGYAGLDSDGEPTDGGTYAGVLN